MISAVPERRIPVLVLARVEVTSEVNDVEIDNKERIKGAQTEQLICC